MELRQIEAHLRVCRSCNAMVSALREENRALIHCIQEIDLGVKDGVKDGVTDGVTAAASAAPVAQPAPARPRDVMKFGGLLVGVAAVVRLAMSSPDNFVLPASPVSLDWLDPSDLAGRLNWFAGAVVFVATQEFSKMLSLVEGLSMAIVSAVVLGGLVMLLRRSGKTVLTATLAAMATLLLMVSVSTSSYAMDVRVGAHDRDTVTVIAADEIIDDSLFATGDSVIVDGTVTGDLIAFARQVTVHGAVNGSIFTGAQSIVIEGPVGGSIIAFGQNTQINGKVTHNVLSLAQSFTLGKDGSIAGDAATLGSESHINGDLAHDFYAFGTADIAGRIGRNVEFRGSTITLLPTARVDGNLSSHVPRAETVHIDPGAVLGGKQTVVLPQPGRSKYSTFSFYFFQVLHVVAAFVAGMILLMVFPGLRRVRFSEIGATLISGGIGFLALVAMPVAAVILLITLIGIPLALFGFAAWLLGLYLAKILVANFVGRTLLSTEGDQLSSVALSLFVGLALVFVAINLPYVGGLIQFLLVLIGFGGLLTHMYRAHQGTAVAVNNPQG
jgi:hypothetical protein